jgi:hypothetical protein
MKYIIWGIGFHLKNNLNLDVAMKCEYFIDFDYNKQGKKFLGREVCSSSVLQNENPETTVVIITTPKNYREISVILEDYGFIENESFFLEKNYGGNDEFPSLHNIQSWEGYESEFYGTAIFEIRSRYVARMIGDDVRTVVDLGAGKMLVKSFLSDNTQYIPVDYKAKCAETVVCDFNLQQFPKLKDVDCMLLVGVLDWINNPEWLLKSACVALRRGGVLIVMALQPNFEDYLFPPTRSFSEWTNLIPVLNSLGLKIVSTCATAVDKAWLVKCIKDGD